MQKKDPVYYVAQSNAIMGPEIAHSKRGKFISVACVQCTHCVFQPQYMNMMLIITITI